MPEDAEGGCPQPPAIVGGPTRHPAAASPESPPASPSPLQRNSCRTFRGKPTCPPAPPNPAARDPHCSPKHRYSGSDASSVRSRDQYPRGASRRKPSPVFARRAPPALAPLPPCPRRVTASPRLLRDPQKSSQSLPQCPWKRRSPPRSSLKVP